MSNKVQVTYSTSTLHKAFSITMYGTSMLQFSCLKQWMSMLYQGYKTSIMKDSMELKGSMMLIMYNINKCKNAKTS